MGIGVVTAVAANSAFASENRVIVDLSEQRADLVEQGNLTLISPIASGKPGGSTPTGQFRVLRKDANPRSRLRFILRHAPEGQRDLARRVNAGFLQGRSCPEGALLKHQTGLRLVDRIGCQRNNRYVRSKLDPDSTVNASIYLEACPEGSKGT